MEDAKRVALITAGARIRRSIGKLEEKLGKIEAELVTLPKGTYRNDKGDACQVIDQQPGATKYALPKEMEEEARQLCGPRKFGQLFDKLVIYQPCDHFTTVAARVLLEDPAQKLVSLCSVPGKAGRKYVRW